MSHINTTPARSDDSDRAERRARLIATALPRLGEDCAQAARDLARTLDAVSGEADALAAVAAAFEARVAEAYAAGWNDRSVGVGFDIVTGRTEANGWKRVSAAKAGHDAAASLVGACALAGRSGLNVAQTTLRSTFPKLSGPAAMRLVLEPAKASCAGAFLFYPKEWDTKR